MDLVVSRVSSTTTRSINSRCRDCMPNGVGATASTSVADATRRLFLPKVFMSAAAAACKDESWRRSTLKLLRQLQELRSRQEAGQELNAAQLEKLRREPEIRQRLEGMEIHGDLLVRGAGNDSGAHVEKLQRASVNKADGCKKGRKPGAMANDDPSNGRTKGIAARSGSRREFLRFGGERNVGELARRVSGAAELSAVEASHALYWWAQLVVRASAGVGASHLANGTDVTAAVAVHGDTSDHVAAADIGSSANARAGAGLDAVAHARSSPSGGGEGDGGDERRTGGSDESVAFSRLMEALLPPPSSSAAARQRPPRPLASKEVSKVAWAIGRCKMRRSTYTTGPTGHACKRPRTSTWLHAYPSNVAAFERFGTAP
eukprot:6208061-Pleurochrysis_carterae.AAC.2